MEIVVGARWEQFIEAMIADGHYASASEVLRDGLRLVQERELKQAALRETIQSAIVEGGSHSVEDVMTFLNDRRDSRN